MIPRRFNFYRANFVIAALLVVLMFLCWLLGWSD